MKGINWAKKLEVLACDRKLRNNDDRGMRWNREPGIPGGCADHGRSNRDRIRDRRRTGRCCRSVFSGSDRRRNASRMREG